MTLKMIAYPSNANTSVPANPCLTELRLNNKFSLSLYSRERFLKSSVDGSAKSDV